MSASGLIGRSGTPVRTFGSGRSNTIPAAAPCAPYGRPEGDPSAAAPTELRTASAAGPSSEVGPAGPLRDSSSRSSPPSDRRRRTSGTGFATGRAKTELHPRPHTRDERLYRPVQTVQSRARHQYGDIPSIRVLPPKCVQRLVLVVERDALPRRAAGQDALFEGRVVEKCEHGNVAVQHSECQRGTLRGGPEGLHDHGEVPRMRPAGSRRGVSGPPLSVATVSLPLAADHGNAQQLTWIRSETGKRTICQRYRESVYRAACLAVAAMSRKSPQVRHRTRRQTCELCKRLGRQPQERVTRWRAEPGISAALPVRRESPSGNRSFRRLPHTSETPARKCCNGPAAEFERVSGPWSADPS